MSAAMSVFVVDSGYGPLLNKNTLIGILICVTGNILISLALNIQKLAHHRVAEAKESIHGPPTHGDLILRDALDNIEERSERTRSQADQPFDQDDISSPVNNDDTPTNDEARPLLSFPSNSEPIIRTYGAPSSPQLSPRKSFSSRVLGGDFSLGRKAGLQAATHERSPHANGHPSADSENPIYKPDAASSVENAHESHYLKSKLWWTGFVLMNVGECGNFISYAWAPASIVAPLGTFALIANCFFAPLILHERFRKRDMVGITLSIVGAVTVVLSTPSSSDGDPRLNPSQLIAAISRTPFIVYTVVYLVGIVILMTLSNTSAGRRFVFIDVGVCALFGGFTVLSTKAVSSLLTMEWIRIFTEWITYPSVAVLLLTGIGQIRYLNRALMHFDSKVVIPIQFVLFNLSAIVGSSILYGDFANAELHQIVTFLYGCTATFAGVFVITWSSRESVPPETYTEHVASPRSENQSIAESVARRRGPTNYGQSSTASRSTPALHKRQSVISLTALSQAQLLLAHPHHEGPLPQYDIEHGTPASAPRRWTTWIAGEEAYQDDARNRSASLTGDYRGRMGSMPRTVGRPRLNNDTRSQSWHRDWVPQTRDPGSISSSFNSAATKSTISVLPSR